MRMPYGADDPRQILSVLNSLGFVGITAEQLKTFMKDLKLYRKIKDTEREKWRDETRKRIFSEQREALAEIINQSFDDISQLLTNSDEPSVVKFQIKCLSNNETSNDSENDKKPLRLSPRNKFSTSQKRDLKFDNNSSKKCTEKIIMSESGSKSEEVTAMPRRPTSVREFPKNIPRRRSRSKSVTSDATIQPNSSRSSSRSQSKSFIRPWKLHPEIQRPTQKLKSDPVLLYQQYQKEWKQRLLPGENRHDRIRWAVRERMLGIDPTPRPMPKRSSSFVNVKKR